jgi:hypothetical protein
MLIVVNKNETDYYLEMWNRAAIEEAGISYKLILINKDTDYIISTLEDIIK